MRHAFSTLSRRAASFRSAAPRTFSTMPRTWGRPAEGPTFHPDFPTEFRPSPIAGVGWWATVDIPKGTLLRRLSVLDGSLVRFSSREDLEEAGWDLDDAVNYGIGHWRDPSAIFFLNPGTAVNHADKTREAAVMYNHDEPNVLELYTTKDVKAGEEMLCDYDRDYAPCPWYDELQRSRGNVPLSQLNAEIEKMYF